MESQNSVPHNLGLKGETFQKYFPTTDRKQNERLTRKTYVQSGQSRCNGDVCRFHIDRTEEVTCTEGQRTFQSETIPTGSKQNVLILLSQCQSERVQG